MKLAERLHNAYMAIRSRCAIVTAADGKYAPYMFNMLASLHANFPTHPMVYVFDIGMTWAQRCELSQVPWLRLVPVPEFVGHWRLNWSWKPYALLQPAERYILYFDSANIVVLRSLERWFLSIQKNSYFVLSAQQPLRDITPSDYWALVGLEASVYSNEEVFGAGILGYDSGSSARDAIQEAYDLTKDGWTLGCSANETNKVYDRSVIRDCTCFRADQTLINLTLRKHIGGPLWVRDPLKYCGVGGRCDHPAQYVWYARRSAESMLFLWTPLYERSILFYYNRVVAMPRIVLAPYKGRLVRALRRRWSRKGQTMEKLQ